MNLKLIKIVITSPGSGSNSEWTMDMRVETGSEKKRDFVESSWQSSSCEVLITGIPLAIKSLVPKLNV